MTKVSNKISDIKVGRILELAAVPAGEGVRGRKAVAIQVTGVTVYRTSAEVTGVKLDRSGAPHRSGKQHKVEAVEGSFRVSWSEGAPAAVAAAETDNVQHADGTDGE